MTIKEFSEIAHHSQGIYYEFFDHKNYIMVQHTYAKGTAADNYVIKKLIAKGPNQFLISIDDPWKEN